MTGRLSSKVYLERVEFPSPIMSASETPPEKRRELREALDNIRKEVDKVRKDLAATTKTWVKATGKAVQEATPKVAATVDETMQQTSKAFQKSMSTLGRETKQVQVSFLRSYRTVLSKQMDFIEKRLKELSK